MSTLLISIDRYERLASTLTYIGHLDPQSNCLEHDSFRLFGLNGFKNTFEELEQKVNIFVSDLIFSNEDAFNIRYGENNKESCLLSGYQRAEAFKNKCELLKALQCIRYNCDSSLSKGNERLLNEIISTIKDYIILELPAYQEADWF